jgi:GntR family transcriptional regulator
MLHLTIFQGDGIPIYAQLITQIKAMIATGRLKPDEELPSVRQLAQQLVLNPNTIVRAYRELESQGLVYKKRGSGTFVSSEITPYTDDVVRKKLAERMDALIVEGVNMGFDEKQMMELFQKRWQEILQTTSDKPGE